MTLLPSGSHRPHAPSTDRPGHVPRRRARTTGWIGLLRGLVALVLVGSTATAQLDLPSKPRPVGKRRPSITVKPTKGGGGVAPFLLCDTCESRNYTAKIQLDPATGTQTTWCATCRAESVHSMPAKREDLELPNRPATVPDRAPGTPSSAPSKGSEAAPLESAEVTGNGMSSGVRLVWESVAEVEDSDDPIAVGAVPTLLAFGDSGVLSARGKLASKHGPTVLTAARVLLRSGEPTDADRVVASLRERLPGSIGPDLLGELASLDPVRATPRLFCELLDHSQFPMRAAAERLLRGRLDADLVPLLGPALASSRGDARFRAVDLLARLDHPATTEPLLERIADPRAKVAWRAVEALSRSKDPRVEERLLARAFGDRWILRASAYAILAIVEREDQLLVPILGADQVPALLRGMAANDPFVAGSCAAALAGIGFRSPSSTASPWLDREVPEHLLSTVVGDRFFDDFSSLKGSALRRLEQITGVSFGPSGPEWARWWLENESEFRASRAILAVSEGGEGDLEVRFQSAEGDARAVVLRGPDRADPPGAPGELFYLSMDESRDFLALLRREGVLGRDRLPGRRGNQSQRGRRLEIHAGDQSKVFAFGSDASEPWFERAVQMVDALVERNLWQRYPHPADHMGSRRALWEAEGAWWNQTHDDHQRALGLKGLILSRLPDLEPLERESDLRELEALYRTTGAAEISDFTRLVALLLDEAYYSPTARKLTALARRAAGLEEAHDAGATGARSKQPATQPGAAEPVRDGERAKLARDLITLLYDEFEAAAAEDISALVGLLGTPAVREAASDERPLLRAIAASRLAISEDPIDRALLLGLLADEDPGVEVAAVVAAGRERVEEARVELLLRAGDANPDIRIAALRAIGFLGGEHALDALVTGLADGNQEVRVAAAEGLSELADPNVSSLLVSLLRQGSSSAVFAPARRGLLNLGEEAWDDLFAALRSSSPAAQREAALLLSYQACPDAASTLMRLLTQNPEDLAVAGELAVLTCVDMRGEVDPADAWWGWWDTVRHDDARAWFFAAAEAREIAAPEEGAFDDGGTEEGIGFLIRLMAREEPWLAERARRELIRTSGRDIGTLPAAGIERDLWLGTLYEVLIDTRD